MPALKNPKHERFAQQLSKGNTADAAYVEAGYRENRHNAAALARSQHISTRVAEIQERGALRAEVTIATLTADLLRLRDKGEALMDAAGLSVARNSVMDIAKLNGLVIDKSQSDINAALSVRRIEREIIDPASHPDS